MVTSKKETVPLKLKALERLTIMLERMKPTSMVMRVGTGTKSGVQLQLELLKIIREEFEHNVSMQIYVNQTTWALIKRAKEETITLIKLAGGQAGQDSGSMQLSRIIFELEAKTQNAYLEEALKQIRAEAERVI